MKTVRDILKEFVLYKVNTEESYAYSEDDLDQAIQEINAYYKSKVPKKKQDLYQGRPYISAETRGYNQAIDDFYILTK